MVLCISFCKTLEIGRAALLGNPRSDVFGVDVSPLRTDVARPASHLH